MTTLRRTLPAIALVVMMATATTRAQAPLSSAWTYQGRLSVSGEPLNGAADFEFTLWDADVAGAAYGSTIAIDNVQIVDGLFTVDLDFGVLAFNGDARWIEIAVRSPHDPADAQPFTTLAPRQPMTPAPMALALRGFQTTEAGAGAVFPGSWNVVGGHAVNYVETDVSGATICGGGAVDNPNEVYGAFGVIGGGYGNFVADLLSTVAGGANNVAGERFATVCGGSLNSANGRGSFVGGGGKFDPSTNSNVAGGRLSVVTGGSGNVAVEPFSTIGGGANNLASNSFATVSGGASNTASGIGAFIGGGGEFDPASSPNVASGRLSVVAGGSGNMASGDYSVSPGGQENIAAGDFSFAAGRKASARHDGAFVWADSQLAEFASTAGDQFLIRASGGVGINRNDPATALDVNGTVTATAFVGDGSGLTGVSAGDASYGSSAGSPNDAVYVDDAGAVGIGVTSPSQALHVAGNVRTDGYIGVGADPIFPLHIETEGVPVNAYPGANENEKAYLQLVLNLANVTGGGMAIGGGGGFFDLSDGYITYLPLNSGQGIRVQGTVKVVNNAWPDYVFEEGYRLRPLKDVEDFIQAHGHLPDVPSAAEIHSDGVDVSEMNAVLLRKIEEMTLHMIEMRKEIDRLKAGQREG
ncbi:MAG TPA: hypothetical protein P5081_09360 [Phycisphaerae bacterium]|nr:hypothetical protein [Phycisphaerae bacterium]HRW53085.1 hypothetical protein [Phycisphaerae bacterium]